MEYGGINDRFEREDSIYDSARIFEGRGGVGEGFGDGVMLCARRKLYEEAIALSEYVRRLLGGGDISVLLIDGGMYDTSLLTVACSFMGCPLTLIKEAGERELSCDLLVAAEIPNDGIVYKSFLSFGEINAVVLGELSSISDIRGGVNGEGFSVRFFDDGGELESYPEQMAVRLARRFARAEGIFWFDVCLTTLDPCTRDGFFAGVLAPMLYAKRWFYCEDGEGIFERMRLCSPTKLICAPTLVKRLAKEMQRLKNEPSAWRRGRGSHPVRMKLDKLFPRTRAALRRLKMIYVHQSFGGRLAGVSSFGELDCELEGILSSFGVICASLVSSKRCALAGHRFFGDREGVWRLPDGLFADMCDVRSGGFGRITLYGDGISFSEADGHSFKVGDFRLERGERRLLVSEFEGFSTSKREFYAKKR